MTKNKVQDYDSICAELDKLSILMLDAMKEYMDCKVNLENHIKTGSLNLAKARYIMGNKSVSSLQLPTEDCDIMAQTRVLHSKQKKGSSECLVFEISRLSINQETDNTSVKHRGPKSKDRSKDDLVNKTKETEQDLSKTKFVDESGINNSGEKVKSSPGKVLAISRDPMKWFGVLVPQNLKYAQTDFSTALEYIIQCANIQVEMESIRSKYTNLMKQKQECVTTTV